MNLKKRPRLTSWQQALLHAFLAWFLFNTYSAVDYGFRVARDGYFIFYEDGTPLTEWKRFLEFNSDWKNLVLLLAPLAVELNYHLVFKRRSKKLFLFASFLLAVTLVLVAMFANNHNEHLTAIDFLPSFLIFLSYAVLYAFVRHSIHHQIRQAETKRQHTQAELDALKAHLNPHFFFNTLNNLYGTALEEKAEKTAHSVEQLSGIMRYVLTEAQQNFTDVSNEINFLQDYLKLQRVRLPARDNIQLHLHVHHDGNPALIAPLLLIPFIENAFKYGISVDRKCSVRLELGIKNKQLELTIENQVFPDRQLDKGAGTGIAHVRKRLELLYPNQHQLEIHQNGQFTVRLQLTLR